MTASYLFLRLRQQFGGIYIASYPWVGRQDMTNLLRMPLQNPFCAGIEGCGEQVVAGPRRKVCRMAAAFSVRGDDQKTGILRNLIEKCRERRNFHERVVDGPEQKARFGRNLFQCKPYRTERAVVRSRIGDPPAAEAGNRFMSLFILCLADKEQVAEAAAHGFEPGKHVFQKG